MLYFVYMKKTLLIVVSVCLLGVGLYLAFGKDDTAADQSSNKQPKATTQSNHTSSSAAPTELFIGNANAPIMIIEYGDYKCPKCNDFHQKAGKDIRREWVDSGKAKIIYRPYPLFGEDSGLALYASFCAAEQGKFTAYHDTMFSFMWDNYFSKSNFDATTQKLFSPERLGELAGEAGLDAAAFTTCAGGRTHATAYNLTVDKAASDSVQGTPTLIIGGQKIVGPQPYSVYKALLEIESAK